MDKLTTNEQTKAGENIALVLGLKLDEHGRYPTTIGNKTALGLYLTIQRIIAGEIL